MSNLVQIGKKKTTTQVTVPPAGRRPEWLRVQVRDSDTYRDVGKLLEGLSLNTVCEEARCPNIWECWGQHRTATFMILGDMCTRNCRYCSVKSGRPDGPPDANEPQNVAEAVRRLGLRHTVITSVDRDDLPDYGAGHFVATIRAVRNTTPECRIEVLIPDFMGDEQALELLLASAPDIVDHNTETVPRLFRKYRSKGVYARTLEVLARTDAWRRTHKVAMTTKTGLMLGLGETFEEILAVMDDLRKVNCDVLTLGQYLNPTVKHAKIQRYYTPDEFAELKREAMARGFLHCESGPLVRSSYHAHEHVPQG